MTKKSSLGQISDSKIYLTEGLAERLDMDTVIGDPAPATSASTRHFTLQTEYIDDGPAVEEVSEMLITVSDSNPDSAEIVTVQGVIRILSFGTKGWMCQMDGVPRNSLLDLANVCSKKSPDTVSVKINPTTCVTLEGDLDFSGDFFGSGRGCTLTVSADRGRTI